VQPMRAGKTSLEDALRRPTSETALIALEAVVGLIALGLAARRRAAAARAQTPKLVRQSAR
jgi:hypothetical protein